MDKNSLTKFCMLPKLTEIEVEKRKTPKGSGHRTYWQWCDENGKPVKIVGNTDKQEFSKIGEWKFLVDVFTDENAMQTYPAPPGDEHWEKLLSIATELGYIDYNKVLKSVDPFCKCILQNGEFSVELKKMQTEEGPVPEVVIAYEDNDSVFESRMMIALDSSEDLVRIGNVFLELAKAIKNQYHVYLEYKEHEPQ